jgi:hypothetical protein
MASQIVYACDAPLESGVCNGNTVQFTVDSDLGEALNAHAIALENNTLAMNDFFQLSVDDVSLISASMLIFFIIGNSTGKIVSLFRKV